MRHHCSALLYFSPLFPFLRFHCPRLPLWNFPCVPYLSYTRAVLDSWLMYALFVYVRVFRVLICMYLRRCKFCYMYVIYFFISYCTSRLLYWITYIFHQMRFSLYQSSPEGFFNFRTRPLLKMRFLISLNQIVWHTKNFLRFRLFS